VTAELARGVVVRVRLDPAEGREIRKTRPAVVVSNDAACHHDAVVQIVPITALPDRRLRPYEARIGVEMSGLDRPSRAVANQVRTVAKERIVEVLGQLAATELQRVDCALAIQLGLTELCDCGASASAMASPPRP
jgi:mRNA interferase MazF